MTQFPFTNMAMKGYSSFRTEEQCQGIYQLQQSQPNEEFIKHKFTILLICSTQPCSHAVVMAELVIANGLFTLMVRHNADGDVNISVVL